MNARLKVYGFLLLVAALGAVGYFLYEPVWGDAGTAGAHSANPTVETPIDRDEVPVELATAQVGRISSFLRSTANLRPRREVEAAAQTEGIIHRLLVEEGDMVKKDQLLCQLDDSQFQLRLRSSQQRLAQARLQMAKASEAQDKAETQLENAQQDLTLYQQLYDDKLVSQREVALLQYKVEELEHDQRLSTSEVRELEHRVEELQAAIEESKLEISQTEIRAPFRGHITERLVEIGQAVRGLEPLFRVTAMFPLYADVYLAEGDAGYVQAGQKARVQLGAGGERVVSRVQRVSPVVDQNSGTVKVIVELGEDSREFKPGAFVRVRIQTDSREGAILIPKRAVIEEDGQHFVFVVRAQQARRVPVRLGYEESGTVEILEGIQAGQSVVVAGQGSLKEGARVHEVAS